MDFLRTQQPLRTVLVVEDVGEISSQMSEMLSRRGHRILKAANAEDAIKIAEHDRPDIILTDLDLPTFDALLQLVHTHKNLGNLPVAIIDINADEMRERDGLRILSNFEQLDELLQSDGQ